MSSPRLSKESAPQFDLLITPVSKGFAFSLSHGGTQTGFEELSYNHAELSQSLEIAKRDFSWLNWPYRQILVMLQSKQYSLIPNEAYHQDFLKAWSALSFSGWGESEPHVFDLPNLNAVCSAAFEENEVKPFKSAFPRVKFVTRALALHGWAEVGSDSAVILPEPDGFHLAVFEAGEPVMFRFCEAVSAQNAIEMLTVLIQASTLAPLTTALYILPAPFFSGFMNLAQSRFKSVSSQAINPQEESLEKLLAARFAAQFLR